MTTIKVEGAAAAPGRPKPTRAKATRSKATPTSARRTKGRGTARQDDADERRLRGLWRDCRAFERALALGGVQAPGEVRRRLRLRAGTVRGRLEVRLREVPHDAVTRASRDSAARLVRHLELMVLPAARTRPVAPVPRAVNPRPAARPLPLTTFGPASSEYYDNPIHSK